MYEKEKKEILELLSKGLINSNTAETLLTALDNKHQVVPTAKTTVVENDTPKGFKKLQILIDTADGDDVNITIPIEFAKVLKNQSFGGNAFKNNNIDIDQIIDIASSGIEGEIINIDTGDGDSIIIRII